MSEGMNPIRTTMSEEILNLKQVRTPNHGGAIAGMRAAMKALEENPMRKEFFVQVECVDGRARAYWFRDELVKHCAKHVKTCHGNPDRVIAEMTVQYA